MPDLDAGSLEVAQEIIERTVRKLRTITQPSPEQDAQRELALGSLVVAKTRIAWALNHPRQAGLAPQPVVAEIEIADEDLWGV